MFGTRDRVVKHITNVVEQRSDVGRLDDLDMLPGTAEHRAHALQNGRPAARSGSGLVHSKSLNGSGCCLLKLRQHGLVLRVPRRLACLPLVNLILDLTQQRGRSGEDR